MARDWIEMKNTKELGASEPICTANSAPPRLPMAAPHAKASSLYRTVLTPMASATCSSSRIAFQARPTRELASRHDTKAARRQNPSAR